MLKIDVAHGAESTRFTVEGKLIGPWVTELERCWHTAGDVEPHTPIAVNLASVTSIDSTGVDLLTRMCRKGVVLVPAGVLMDEIVREIRDEVANERRM